MKLIKVCLNKIRTLGVILILGMASFVSSAQDEVPGTLFEIGVQQGSTAHLINLLEQKSGYIISYSSRLCMRENIRLTSSRNTLLGFLRDIFRDCPFHYVLNGEKIILLPLPLSRQSFTISGYVSDAQSGERLLGTNIYDDSRLKGTTTNNYGFFSLTLPAGNVALNASFVGYKAIQKRFYLTADTVVHFQLQPSIQLAEVAVIGTRIPDMISYERTGTVRMSMEQIHQAPALFGEVDLMRGVQMLPGIQSGSEGFSGIYVRGGGPDQNLVLLDDVPVYNVGHLLGFFSIFNSEAVKQVSVTKGGFPARYGGRLSSVLDVRTKDGSEKELGGNLTLGLLSSGLSLNGPVFKERSTFLLSFRRTYVDALAAIYQIGNDERTNYYFFDLNGKINYRFSDKSKLYLSTYWGRDKFYTLYNFQNQVVEILPGTEGREVGKLNDESNAGWGNFVSALRWNYVFNARLFSNFTFTFSNYRFFIGLKRNDKIENTWNLYDQRYFSGIHDYNLKADLEYYLSPRHTIRFGGSGVLHRFNPGVDVIRSGIGTSTVQQDTILGDFNVYGQEYHAYAEDEFALGERWSGNAGIHFSLFRGEGIPYWSVEPRLSLRYIVSPRLSLKSTWAEMSQFIHLVGTSGFTLPTDLWLPVSNKIKPMYSSQYSLGVDIHFGKNKRVGLSLEAYYKTLDNLLAYKESTGFFDYSTSWEDKLTAGNGESMGAELLLQKMGGSLTGWIGYTYAKTTNQFDELNDGKVFAARFDRRHDASVFFNYRFNSRISGSLTWLLGSGNPVTLPEEKNYAPELPFSNQPAYGYSENALALNNYRMPLFHRMDAGLNFTKMRKRGERIWSIGVINLYGRQNPFLLYFKDNESVAEGSTLRNLKQLSLFPFPIPYVRYSFKF